ncbi:MAG: HIT family protein [Lachnospiraceae bacterium]|nr:HIT family protein [Lachnospiraceae bacterium]
MKKQDCIFCNLANGIWPAEAIYEDDKVKVILDAGPASKGHALILPKEHADDMFDLDEESAAHIFVVANKVAKAMKKTLNCDGMNILQNNGPIAGQTVFHFHLHLIPRYEGDGIALTWKPGSVTDEEKSEIIAEIKKGL